MSGYSGGCGGSATTCGTRHGPNGTASGTFISTWGLPGSGDGRFNTPWDMAISGDKVFVADMMNHRIQVFNTSGTYLTQWGAFGKPNPIGQGAEGLFDNPMGIAVGADGNIYVVDSGNSRVQKFR